MEEKNLNGPQKPQLSKGAVSGSTFTVDDMKKAFMAGSNKKKLDKNLFNRCC